MFKLKNPAAISQWQITQMCRATDLCPWAADQGSATKQRSPRTVAIISSHKQDGFSFKSLLVSAFWALLSTTLLPSCSASQPPSSPGRWLGKPALNITAPLNGSVLFSNSEQVSIEVTPQLNADKLTVLLNGRNISSHLSEADCTDTLCTVTATISKMDGLRVGSNVLRVDAVGRHGRVDTQTSRFRLDQLGLGDNQSIFYTPLSVGIQTKENGGNGNTWVTITTGQPAGVNDPVENYPALVSKDGTTTYPTALPNPDVQFPINCPGWNYQAIVLNRSDPTQLETATCVNEEADMESDFQNKMNRPLGASDLIIFGTTPGNFASSDLDTSGIGGTAWNQSTPFDAFKFPLYYIIIGVKGAAPGTAHEHSLWRSNLDSNGDTPYSWGAFLSGSLIPDTNGYYNYIPGGDTPFQVISGTNPSMQVGSQTYMPPDGSSNGFWLLVLDRNWLAPITNFAFQESNGVQTANCSLGQVHQSCGYFFPTSGFNPAPAQALAKVIANTSPQNLILLATLGCPFDAMSGESQTAIGDALENIGGMNHSVTFMNATTGGCNYALATVNDGDHVRFGSNAALSWNYFTPQNQIGAIHGNLAKDNQGFYDIAAQDQMVMLNNTPVSTVDYTFEGLASNLRVDWPASDTTGKLAAYHDISQQLLTDPQVDTYGPNDYDIRWFYTNQNKVVTNLNGILDSYLAPGATKLVQNTWDTATQDEFAAVRAELLAEIQNADSAQNYLTGGDGSGGMRGLLNGTTGTILATAIDVANDIAQDATVANATKTSFSVSTSEWVSLATGVLSLTAKAVAPEAAPALGLLSGALRAGSAAGTPLAPQNITQSPQVIAGPSTAYDNTLAELITDTNSYIVNNLLYSFDAATNAVLSDSGKLSVAGSRVEDTSSGWQVNSLKGDTISQSLAAGAKTSLWNGILGQLYGLRVATGVSATRPGQLGSEVSNQGHYSCQTAYANVPADSWSVYPHLAIGSLWDINILAEGPTWQGGNQDYPVSTNLVDLLTTNETITFSNRTETGLNIPRLELLTNGPMTYSQYAHIGPFGSCVID